MLYFKSAEKQLNVPAGASTVTINGFAKRDQWSRRFFAPSTSTSYCVVTGMLYDDTGVTLRIKNLKTISNTVNFTVLCMYCNDNAFIIYLKISSSRFKSATHFTFYRMNINIYLLLIQSFYLNILLYHDLL